MSSFAGEPSDDCEPIFQQPRSSSKTNTDDTKTSTDITFVKKIINEWERRCDFSNLKKKTIYPCLFIANACFTYLLKYFRISGEGQQNELQKVHKDSKGYKQPFAGYTIKNGSKRLRDCSCNCKQEEKKLIQEYEYRLKAKDDFIERTTSEKEAAEQKLKTFQKDIEALEKLNKSLKEETSKRLSTVEQVIKRLEVDIERCTEAQERLFKSKNETLEHTQAKEQESKKADSLMLRQQLKESVEEKFRGSSHNPETSSEEFFGSDSYCEVMEEIHDWSDSDLGGLLDGTTKHSFASVRDTLLWGCQVLMIELFQYQPKVLHSKEEENRLLDISHAYGLLIYHFKQECWGDLPRKFKENVQADEKFNHLYQRVQKSAHKKIFDEFKKNLHKQMRSMLSVSPPMVIHHPKKFEKDMIQRIPKTSEQQPLKWLQPVVMNNYYGMVCAKGRAGNKDDLLKLQKS